MEKEKSFWKKPESYLWSLLVLLTAIFLTVMWCSPAACVVGGWLGTGNDKQETLKFIGLGMGGIIAVIGAIAINRRADAQIKSAEAQAETAAEQAENNRLTEKGHVQDRFKAATEHLGNERPGMRIGAYYEFCQLARENPDLRKIIFDMLCAHLRQLTNASEYKKIHGKHKPTEGVQTLLDLLFNEESGNIFQGLKANLQRVYLVGANLYAAHMPHTDFSDSYLIRANLRSAELQYAIFSNAQMHAANMSYANMQRANFFMTQMLGVSLTEAKMQMANLELANVRGANLSATELQCADLTRAHFEGAVMNHVYLQGADLSCTDFRGATKNWQLLGFRRNIDNHVNIRANLETCTFEGGMNQVDVKDIASHLVRSDREYFQREMEKHYVNPKAGLSVEKCAEYDIKHAAYTKEDAKKWIASYDSIINQIFGK